MAEKFLDQGATFNEVRGRRFLLWRTWDADRPTMLVIGLNPSTADENVLDPTLRKCVGFAKLWGYGKLFMANVYSFRSTDPVGIRTWNEPDDENTKHILLAAAQSSYVLAAWGSFAAGGVYGRARLRNHSEMLMAKLDRQVDCLGMTNDWYPRHPLYIPYTQLPATYWRQGMLVSS